MNPPPGSSTTERPLAGTRGGGGGLRVSRRDADTQRRSVDALRGLAIDAVERANSGHPGMPMAMAPVAYVLFSELMRHNPRDPDWPDRDRFVLSAGHGSMLLYGALHLCGYDLGLDDLREFRQWGSRTPGHPERDRERPTPGVETTTGPLGQGFGNGVGMALAERLLRERYGADVVDHRTFAICSDGDLMEGVAAEAASLAGHLGLGRLVYVWDDNGITIDGSTRLSFAGEDVAARFDAYGWQVLEVADANDLDALRGALTAACAEEARPSLVRVRSVIGWPAPGKQGSAVAHGAPLGTDEARAAKRALGLDPDGQFDIAAEVYADWSQVARGAALQSAWRARLESWREHAPGAALELARAWKGRASGYVGPVLPEFDPADKPKLATRAASGQVMEAFGELVPTMAGGSADLASSVKAGFGDERSFTREAAARTIHWGVREHAMAAAVNGLALHGGIVRPYAATFLAFADYMRPAIRLSALMGLPVAWVFSHDSAGLGEDGPTHQPIEQLAALRAIPGLAVIRPADAAETAQAWRVIVEELDGPACLVLTRQGVPVLARGEHALASAEGLARGGYVLAGPERPDVTLIGTGSEVHIALDARERLLEQGIAARVVSLPSWELFAAQERDYRDGVLSAGVPRVAVEAGCSQGWERFTDATVTIDRFGASAPGDEALARLGITPDAVVDAALGLLGG